MHSFYNKLTSQLSGMDGGNIRSKLWFSGLEWAGNGEFITLEITRPVVDVDGLKIPYLSEEWKLANPNFYKWQFDQKIAKILCETYLYANGYKEYMREIYCDANSQAFKLNLFPLPCKNLATWTDEHKQLSGSNIKYHYQTHCAATRFTLFQKLTMIYKPRVVVCFSMKFIEEYKLAFWGDDIENYEKTSRTLSSRNSISILKKGGSPILVIAPFLGQNLSSNQELSRLGQIIKELLEEAEDSCS